jgi:hypothetical protein
MSNEVSSLKTLLKFAELEEKRLSAERERIDAELQRAREKADLLRRLLGLATGTGETPVGRETHAGPKAESRQVETQARLEDQVARVLQGAGAPLHISKIRQALIDAGVPLPGRGDEANIIVRLARDTERFVRTGRGTYGLKEMGAVEVRPTRMRRVRRG